MKIRILTVFALAILSLSNLSMAKDGKTPEPAFGESYSPDPMRPEPLSEVQATAPSRPQEPISPRRTAAPQARTPASLRPPVLSTPPAASEGPTVVKIFELEHASAVDMSNLMMGVFRIRVSVDSRLNCLIVSTTQEQMESVENLIAAMDVAAPEASTSRDAQDLVYRVYMFEIPSEDEGMKSFMLRLQTPSPDPMQPNPSSVGVSARELLDAAVDKDLRIIEFVQTGGESPDSEIETLIQGKAASDESLRRLVEKFPASRITELRWDDDETFTSKIAAAHYSQLPEQIQKHIHKFLGDDIRTVGYWFGNLSAPGSVEAPIGPWILNLRLDAESDRMLELLVDVELPSAVGNDILSNTIRAKIGKPIIIGYNRESYGTRKMGAMVIVPEEDSL